MSDIGTAIDTGKKLVDLLERVMALVTGNASFAKIGKHVRSQVNEMADEFDDLARRYFDSISTFQASIDEAKSFDDIGSAIVALRRDKYGLVFDRWNQRGRRDTFSRFITLHEDHRASSLMKQLDEYSSLCDQFFACAEYDGIASVSWATALEELANGFENHTGVAVEARGEFREAKKEITSGTESALRQMAFSTEKLTAKITELRETMRYRFW